MTNQLKLTPDEELQIDGIVEATDEHPGLVDGRDVLALALMMRRLFGNSKPEPPAAAKTEQKPKGRGSKKQQPSTETSEPEFSDL